MMTVSRVPVILKGLGATVLAFFLTACNNGSNSANNTTTTTPATLTTSDLSGTYVFSAAGTNSSDGDYFVAGSLIADGKGNITSGIADYNLGSGIDSSVPLTGTYTVSGGVASFKVTDSGSVTDTFTASVIKTGSTALTAFDGTGTGTLYAQGSGFTSPGSYFYTLKGEGEGVVTGSGEFVVGAAQTLTSGTLNYTDGSNTMTYPTITGFLFAPDTDGRGQAALGGNDFSYYPVSSTQVLMVGLDDRNLLMATAQKQ